MPRKDRVLVANGQGFWGDSILGPVRLVREGPLDYLTLDYLAEVTMSIMQKLRSRNPDAGYATDFVEMIDRVLPDLVAKDIRVVANAGGVNPRACMQAVMKVIRKHGFRGVGVGIVEGDDVFPNLDALLAQGEELRNMDTGAPLSAVRDRVTSANVYLSAFPIAEALDRGARIVITGRGTDPGLVLGPLIHEFGWKRDDYDLLAAGTVAGHIVECGAQCTGGNFTDWRRIPDMARIGYPIVEARADGTFVVTKHAGTGGAVTVRTVTEQLVYEMGDPRSYITPDVVADFGSIRLEQAGRDRVRVWGVRGRPAPASLKVSASYFDGWKATGSLIISAPEAADKARAFADLFWRRLGLEFTETHSELVGHSACWGPLAAERDPAEVLLRLSVRDQDRARIEQFAKMIPAVILSGPPGVAVTGGRPQAQDVVAYWPALVPRDRVKPCLVTRDGEQSLEWPTPLLPAVAPPPTPRFSAPSARGSTKPVTVPLLQLAHARSGDKGDMCNIGVIARAPEIYPWLRRTLTAQLVKRRFKGICHGRVERHEVPNLMALNFLLYESLGGGGTVSLRLDAQGKTLSHALLAMEVRVPKALVDAAARADEVVGAPPKKAAKAPAKSGRRR